MDEELDEYGHLPHDFTLNEFNHGEYFDKTIKHNNIRWLRINEPQMITEIKYLDERKPYTKYFVVNVGNGQKYRILMPTEWLGIKSRKRLYEALTREPWFDHFDDALPLEYGIVLGEEYEEMYYIYTPGGELSYEDLMGRFENS